MATAAEYLKARGWISATGFEWQCEAEHPDVSYCTENAVIVQRARDAAEERAAWVQFAAGVGAGVWAHTGICSQGQNAACAEIADSLLDAYRARFAIEVKP